jgi:hypothetical protein
VARMGSRRRGECNALKQGKRKTEMLNFCGARYSRAMSAPAPTKHKAPPSESFTDVVSRFGRWCVSNPLELALLVGVLGTLIWFYLGYHPLSGGSKSFGNGHRKPGARRTTSSMAR